MKREWKKLLAFVMALLMVVGILPGNMAGSVAYAATNFTGGEEVTSGNWAGWTWSVFGNSTNTTDNTISEDGKGNITLSSKNGKGKIASGNEGINYLYYKLDKGQDFILKTSAKVNDWVSKDQDAFGLMIRAAVGEHGKTADASPLNSAIVGANYQKGLFLATYRTNSIKRFESKKNISIELSLIHI